MASVNKVIIVGNLGQDPELRYTASQAAVATLNVATTDRWTGKDGKMQESTEWHRIIVWGKQAENTAKFLAKGRSVYVEGRLQTRSWDDKNGQKRYTTEIIANNVQFLGASQQPQGGFGGELRPGSFAGNSYESQNRFSANANQFPHAEAPMSSHISDGDGMDLAEIPF